MREMRRTKLAVMSLLRHVQRYGRFDSCFESIHSKVGPGKWDKLGNLFTAIDEAYLADALCRCIKEVQFLRIPWKRKGLLNKSHCKFKVIVGFLHSPLID